MTAKASGSDFTDIQDADSIDPGWEKLSTRLGPAIAYYPRLVDVTGGAKAAILLCQMLYWTRTGRGVVERDGWFYKTAPQWTLETGLSRREQATARRDLVRSRVLEERLTGIPARLYFRVRLERLEAWLDGRLQPTVASAPDGRVERVLRALGAATPYFPRLSGLASSANSALLLSRSIALTRHASADETRGIVRSMEAWCRETGLSLAEYQLARRTLAGLGLWSVSLRGIPARTCVELDVDALSRRLMPGSGLHRCDPQLPQARADTPQTGKPCSCVCAQPAAVIAPRQSGGNPITGCAESRELEGSEISGVRLQTPTSADPPEPLAGQVCEAPPGLAFPPGFDEAERTAAAGMLGEVAHVAQDILDELHARMASGLVHGQPLQYLRALVGRAKRGEFVIEAGAQIRAIRRRRMLDAEAYRARAAEDERFRAWRERPDYQDIVARRHEEMRRFIESSRRPRGRSPP